jgi:hypothetical protein
MGLPVITSGMGGAVCMQEMKMREGTQALKCMSSKC